MFENVYLYIYISAVSGSLCVGCATSSYFWLCLWDFWLAGWHLLICSGLGTNAQKHSVDDTRSQLFPLSNASWLLLTTQYGRMCIDVAGLNLTLIILYHFCCIITVDYFIIFWNLNSLSWKSSQNQNSYNCNMINPLQNVQTRALAPQPGCWI